jgi:hypothetical protein
MAQKGRRAIPGSRFTLAVDSVRHKIGSASGDAHPRSMMMAHFTLFEGAEQLAECSAMDGQRTRLGSVHLTLLGAEGALVAVEVST